MSSFNIHMAETLTVPSKPRARKWGTLVTKRIRDIVSGVQCDYRPARSQRELTYAVNHFLA
jgi:hypothetical protein